MLRAKEIPPGATFYTSETVGDDRSRMEVRETFYIRDPDGPCRHPHNVRIARIGTIQGDPNDGGPPRYRSINKEPCRDPGEMDGRIMCHLLSRRPAVWEQSI